MFVTSCCKFYDVVSSFTLLCPWFTPLGRWPLILPHRLWRMHHVHSSLNFVNGRLCPDCWRISVFEWRIGGNLCGDPKFRRKHNLNFYCYNSEFKTDLRQKYMFQHVVISGCHSAAGDAVPWQSQTARTGFTKGKSDADTGGGGGPRGQDPRPLSAESYYGS